MVLIKQSSWHMFPASCTLNKLTIQFKYHISIIDDLLNELHKTQFFAKLNIFFGYKKIGWRKYTFLRFSLIHMKGIMSLWWRLLVFSMSHPFFRALWISILGFFYINLLLFFFDDIMIYKKTWEAHVDKNLELLRYNHSKSNIPNYPFMLWSWYFH